MTNYYVITPYEVMAEEEFLSRKEELAKAGRKVMAVVFNCLNMADFSRKYFGS